MGTLNPDIPSEELNQALNQAATIMRGFRQRVLMPEHLLLAFLDGKEYAAHGLLARFAQERAFSLTELAGAVKDQAQSRRPPDIDFDFEAQDGTRVPLSDEMLVVLDEGRVIARARDEIWTGTEDALAAMSQAGVSTAGLLQKRGITPHALSTILADAALARQVTARDLVALAREGQLQPVYFRQNLLRDLLNLLNLAHDRHLILMFERLQINASWDGRFPRNIQNLSVYTMFKEFIKYEPWLYRRYTEKQDQIKAVKYDYLVKNQTYVEEVHRLTRELEATYEALRLYDLYYVHRFQDIRVEGTFLRFFPAKGPAMAFSIS